MTTNEIMWFIGSFLLGPLVGYLTVRDHERARKLRLLAKDSEASADT